MVNTSSLLAAASFGTTFAIMFSVFTAILVAVVVYLIWWVDVKKKTIKDLGRVIKNATLDAFDKIHDLFSKNNVKTVYSDKSLNYSGTEFLPKPTKAPTEQYTYEFVGWDKNAVDEYGNSVVRAIYLQRVTKCVVNVYDDDKTTLLKSYEVEYGSGVNLSDLKPEKPDTKEFSYEFIGWDKEINAFFKNENVCAVYKAVPKKYVYKFVDDDGVTVVSQGSALFGTPITAPAPPKKESTDSAIYEFVGWKNYEKGMLLTRDCTFVAVFAKTNVERKHVSSVIKADGTIVRSYDIAEKSAAPEPKIVKTEPATFNKEEYFHGSVGVQIVKPEVQVVEPKVNTEEVQVVEPNNDDQEVHQKIHLVSAKLALDAEQKAEEKKDETTKLEPNNYVHDNPEQEVLKNLVVNKVKIVKKDGK